MSGSANPPKMEIGGCGKATNSRIVFKEQVIARDHTLHVRAVLTRPLAFLQTDVTDKMVEITKKRHVDLAVRS